MTTPSIKRRCERCQRLDSPATRVNYSKAAGMNLCKDYKSCNRVQKQRAGLPT